MRGPGDLSTGTPPIFGGLGLTVNTPYLGPKAPNSGLIAQNTGLSAQNTSLSAKNTGLSAKNSLNDNTHPTPLLAPPFWRGANDTLKGGQMGVLTKGVLNGYRRCPDF